MMIFSALILCLVGFAAAAAETAPIAIGLPETLPAPPKEETAGRVALKFACSPNVPVGVFPISGGIPLPKGHLISAAHARVVDGGGKEVPAQCSVLATWPDSSIRWLLVEVQADLGQKSSLVLEYGPTVARTAQPSAPLKIEKGADSITFSTGPLQWKASSKPGFRLFDEISFNGKVLTRPGGLCGPTAGDAEAANVAPVDFAVEESGPLRATLFARGVHQDKAGKKHLDYVVRATIWAGLPYIKVEHTFIQTDDPIYLDVRRVHLSLPLANAERAVFGGTDSNIEVSLQKSAAELSQKCGVIEQERWQFPVAVSHNGAVAGKGNRAPGWVDASGPDGGAAVIVRDFWQNCPKGLIAAPDALTVALVPNEKIDPFGLHTGTAKTHDLLYAFHGGDWNAAQKTVHPALLQFQDQPLLICDPEWYAATRALGDMVPVRDGKLVAYEENARDTVVRSFCLQKELMNLYGMLDYGDSLYGQGTDVFFNNMETAFDHGIFVLALRTGDKRLLDQALAASRHYGDVDVRHCQPKSLDYGCIVGEDISPERAEKLTRGLSVKTLGKRDDSGTLRLPVNAPEKEQQVFGGFWAGSTPDPVANDLKGEVYGHSHFHHGHNRADNGMVGKGGSQIGGHTWILGLIDRYLLTGDRRALSDAEEVGQRMLRKPPKQGFRRETGWPAVDLMALFNATGKMEYLKACRDLLQYLADDENAGLGKNTFATYTYTILQATRDYHMATGDPGAKAWFLKGMEAVMAGPESASKRMAKEAEGVFTFVREYGDERVWTTLADLAYAWRLTGDKKFLEVGLANFNVTSIGIPDSVMLWAAPWFLAALEEAGIPVNEKTPAGRPLKYSFFDLRFPTAKRAFWVNHSSDGPFEIVVIQNTGYRQKPYAYEASVEVFGPDGKVAAQRKLDTFGIVPYRIELPKDAARGAYRVAISCNEKRPVFNVATDAAGLVAEIPPTEEEPFGLYTTASEVFLHVPATGKASITVTGFVAQAGGLRLYRPDGSLFVEKSWPIRAKDSVKKSSAIVEIPEGDKGRGGTWKMELASAKNQIAVTGIPRCVATSAALLFTPEALNAK
jgi:hypothetical protein